MTMDELLTSLWESYRYFWGWVTDIIIVGELLMSLWWVTDITVGEFLIWLWMSYWYDFGWVTHVTVGELLMSLQVSYWHHCGELLILQSVSYRYDCGWATDTAVGKLLTTSLLSRSWHPGDMHFILTWPFQLTEHKISRIKISQFSHKVPHTFASFHVISIFTTFLRQHVVAIPMVLLYLWFTQFICGKVTKEYLLGGWSEQVREAGITDRVWRSVYWMADEGRWGRLASQIECEGVLTGWLISAGEWGWHHR